MTIIGLQNAPTETLIAVEICRLQFNPISGCFSALSQLYLSKYSVLSIYQQFYISSMVGTYALPVFKDGSVYCRND